MSLLHVLAFGILLSLDVYLAQLGCSGEGLKLSTGQDVFPSLNFGGGCWRRVCGGSKRGMGEGEKVEIWVGIFNIIK